MNEPESMTPRARGWRSSSAAGGLVSLYRLNSRDDRTRLARSAPASTDPAGELANVRPCSHARFVCSVEDSFGLRDRKRSAFAEDVNEVGQFLSRHFGNHLIANKIHVGIGSLPELRRYDVCTQKGGDHRPRPLLRYFANGAQGLYF